MPKATKPADDCGSCWAFQEQVTDGLGLAEARATRERAACLLWIDGFRAVALETGCHRGLVVMWLSRSGWDVTSVTETVPETMH